MIEETLERIAVALEKIAAAPAGVCAVGEAQAAVSAKRSTRKKTQETGTEPASPTAPAGTTAPAADGEAGADADFLSDEKPAAPTKEEKVKQATIEDVRAKLVEVQTKLKSKDKAKDSLAQYTKGGSRILGDLELSAYPKLIAAADKLLAA